MVPATRRSLLHGVAGLAVTLAGCSGLNGSSEPTPTENVESAPDGPASGSVSDPDLLLLRSDDDRLPIWSGDRSEETPRRTDPIHDSVVVDTPTSADRLSVADSVDRDRLDSFLDGTDFESETLYLQNIRVEECFRLALCQIQWQPDEIRTDYVRRLRPYTEACAVETQVTEARLIRIPAALDADDIGGFGTSVGTGACESGRTRMESGDGEGSGASTGGGG